MSNYNTIGVFRPLAKLLLNSRREMWVKPFMKDVYKYVPVFNRLKEEHKAGKRSDSPESHRPATDPYTEVQPIRK